MIKAGLGSTTQGRIEYASMILEQIFNSPMAPALIPLKLIYSIGKSHGLTREELKKARKELNAVSQEIDRVTYWSAEGRTSV
jgi:hypothetical protein